ncbi:hypothetical protein LK06_024970 [Streptomyces pluripotens]|nr:hypothetical protein LK06_024970 [Streptomyces pluripotens]
MYRLAGTRHSALGTRHSALGTRHSALGTRHSRFRPRDVCRTPAEPGCMGARGLARRTQWAARGAAGPAPGDSHR